MPSIDRLLYIFRNCLFLFGVLLVFNIICDHIPNRNNIKNFPKFVYIANDDFTASEVYLINKAATEWSDQTNGAANIIIDDTYNKDYLLHHLKYNRNNIIILNINKENKETQMIDNVIKQDNPEAQALGFYQYYPNDNAMIYIVSDRIHRKKLFYAVMLHEFGHSFGMEHSAHNHDIMYNLVDETNFKLSDNDINVFCSIYICPLTK